jgi:tRNA pseudouridine65 synthase
MSAKPLVTAQPGPPLFLYRDDDLLLVDKPSGLAMHRGYSSERGDYLLTRVRDAVGFHVYLVNRLDRGTSGVVALTTAPELVEPLQRAFASGHVDKRYLALVRGHVQGEQLIDYAIPKSDAPDAPRVSAQTIIRGIGCAEGRYSLVEAVPLTGRYHQIRRHMKHVHHPLVGDTTYGDGKVNRSVRERFGLMRLALHAAALALPHPRTGDPITVTAKVPAELHHALTALGLPVEVAFSRLGERDGRRSFDADYSENPIR